MPRLFGLALKAPLDLTSKCSFSSFCTNLSKLTFNSLAKLNGLQIVLCVCSVTKLCPTLCNLVDCSPPGPSVLGLIPGKNIRVSCHLLLQGISLTQGLSLHLLHQQVGSFPLRQQGGPLVCARQQLSVHGLLSSLPIFPSAYRLLFIFQNAAQVLSCLGNLPCLGNPAQAPNKIQFFSLICTSFILLHSCNPALLVPSYNVFQIVYFCKMNTINLLYQSLKQCLIH